MKFSNNEIDREIITFKATVYVDKINSSWENLNSDTPFFLLVPIYIDEISKLTKTSSNNANINQSNWT